MANRKVLPEILREAARTSPILIGMSCLLSAGYFLSLIHIFSSAAMAYEVTGKKYYLDAIENGYTEITEKHTYATGG